ncbi:kinase-like domain-containing protein [Paraphysoderma sedebokerense]|nr:kinase-like domain-containing protein [Paraphysoderma sedebokerense]
MTNCIFVVHGPFWYEGERRRKRRLLLRVYGVGTEQYFHREREIFWLDRLSKTGYGPKLLGVFTNGRFEEYLNCETLTKEDIRDPQISPLIASKLFDLHNMVNEFPPSPTSTRDRAEIWGAINKYFYMAMNGVDELLTVYPERKQILDSVKFSEFGSLIDSLKTRLSDVGSPIVFSHNDSQYGNILRHRKTGEIVLVDYEYAGYNYRGYDIANHFIEWTADYHCSTPHVLVPSRYPSQTEQIRFLKAYLDSFEILQSLLTEVEMFTIVSHLMWGLWGLSREIDMLGRREIDFDYFGYGMQRLRWVVDNTDRILEIAK